MSVSRSTRYKRSEVRERERVPARMSRFRLRRLVFGICTFYFHIYWRKWFIFVAKVEVRGNPYPSVGSDERGQILDC